MSKRYFAVHDNLPWGPKHLRSGDELVNPPPESVGVLLDLHLKTGAVRAEAVNDREPKPAAKVIEAAPSSTTQAGASSYRRRDMTAEMPSDTRGQSAGRGSRSSHAVGAMTSEETKKPEQPEQPVADAPDETAK